MKKIFHLIIALMLTLLNQNAKAAENLVCFIAKEKNQIIAQEGDCQTQHSPCSSFKIPLALMGYDAGILRGKTNPELSPPSGEIISREACRGTHNPASWMRDSCVWYSQELTKKLGMQKFASYIKKFDYGNCDLSGDDALSRSWLQSGHLRISPLEQVSFLEKLLASQLPASREAQEFTRQLVFVEDLPNGWKLYGKTGSGCPLNTSNPKDKNLQTGWFVGWLEKERREIVFASLISDQPEANTTAGKRAREIAKTKLAQELAN